MSIATPILLLTLLARQATTPPRVEVSPATRAVITIPSATQPATIPLELTVKTEAASPKTPEVVTDPNRIDLAKVISGEQVLTIDQILRFEGLVQLATKGRA